MSGGYHPDQGTHCGWLFFLFFVFFPSPPPKSCNKPVLGLGFVTVVATAAAAHHHLLPVARERPEWMNKQTFIIGTTIFPSDPNHHPPHPPLFYLLYRLVFLVSGHL
jgi:hypothetical protein